MPSIPQQINPPTDPVGPAKTVVGAKKVELAIVTYRDEYNTQQVQLAVVGDNNVHLLEGRSSGFTKNTTPQGNASEWLRDGIFKALGRTPPTKKGG